MSYKKDCKDLRRVLHDFSNRFMIVKKSLLLYAEENPKHKVTDMGLNSLESCTALFQEIREHVIDLDSQLMASQFRIQDEQILKFVKVMEEKKTRSRRNV